MRRCFYLFCSRRRVVSVSSRPLPGAEQRGYHLDAEQVIYDQDNGMAESEGKSSLQQDNVRIFHRMSMTR